ncbi:MAG TPA: 3-oxoacyl-[acyl-carrier-protein] synthase III C-terminal domain-containing protein [Candidatus Binatia bacterium]|nr:3-oxoacyl-[acyl-carrier-protein] synthase III C-terminal domain-containing protein [Candidatus Binatia bacterium]
MFIAGIGTATPPTRYLQTECWETAATSPEVQQLSLRSRAILKKVLLGNNGIESRCLALNPLSEAFECSPDALHARFVKHAPGLASAAAENALRDAGCNVSEIDGLVVSTCTGYLCPGLTSYVVELLGLRSDVIALDLVGQGCGAALPNLRSGAALLGGAGCEKVLCVCVEVCSAAFYLDNDPGVLISACLFGDGAGAAVITGEAARIKWVDCDSLIDPTTRDLLRFEQKDGRLRNILTPQVPGLAAKYANRVLTGVLDRHGLTRDQIATWIWHAGGRDVLMALQEQLGLDPAAVRWSASVLRELGNVSSSFVFHVLERALREGAPAGHWWMSSFGAGFSCHGALLKV